MGFLGIGDKPKKPKPSAQEIASTEFAAYRQGLDAQYGTPLRVRQIEEARDTGMEDREYGFFSSRANADAAQSEADAFAAVSANAMSSGRGLKNSMSDISRNNRTLASAASEAKTAAKKYSLLRADERRLNAQRAGEELASTTQRTLGGLASAENSLSIAKLRADQEKDSAKAMMWGDIAMSGATIGSKVYDKYKTDIDAADVATQEKNNAGLRRSNDSGYVKDNDSFRRPYDQYGLPTDLGWNKYKDDPTIKDLRKYGYAG